ncbi:MAG: ArsR family transcriptional regulator [Lachnospiraceae bacterium]|nr:ArsR family transcriptional regulator [Lachnospiraceae bacterium]
MNSQANKTIINKQKIVEYLKNKGECKVADIGEYIGLSSARTRVLLFELVDDGKVKIVGNGRSRRYLHV